MDTVWWQGALRRGLFFLLLCLLSVPSCLYAAASVPGVVCRLYASDQFIEERASFRADETFYVLVTLARIAPGEHILTTDWIDPFGALARQDVYTFRVASVQTDYRLASWLQLWKRGMLSRAFTGAEYDDSNFGEWQVILYLDGQQLAKRTFKVV